MNTYYTTNELKKTCAGFHWGKLRPSVPSHTPAAAADEILHGNESNYSCFLGEKEINVKTEPPSGIT